LVIHIFEFVKSPTLQKSLTPLCFFVRCAEIVAVVFLTEADFATARAKASRSGELETLCDKDEEVEDFNFRSVSEELEMDFVFFTKLNEAAVEVVAVSRTAMLLARPVSLSSSELDSTTRLRRPG
jgi:hypothetical protein